VWRMAIARISSQDCIHQSSPPRGVSNMRSDTTSRRRLRPTSPHTLRSVLGISTSYGRSHWQEVTRKKRSFRISPYGEETIVGVYCATRSDLPLKAHPGPGSRHCIGSELNPDSTSSDPLGRKHQRVDTSRKTRMAFVRCMCSEAEAHPRRLRKKENVVHRNRQATREMSQNWAHALRKKPNRGTVVAVREERC